MGEAEHAEGDHAVVEVPAARGRAAGEAHASREVQHFARLALMQAVRAFASDNNAGIVRWMCSFDTTETDVRRFAGRLRAG